LKTKHLVVGQIRICLGWCAANVERGLREVPVEWLKSEWRRRGELKRVQLTISGCGGRRGQNARILGQELFADLRRLSALWLSRSGCPAWVSA